MKKKNLLYLSILFFCVSVYQSGSAEEPSVVGVWVGEVKNRQGKEFKAHLGIRKTGEAYQVKGISQDQSVMWYGEGTVNGKQFIYTYKIRNKAIQGTVTLTIKDPDSLIGTFEEAEIDKSKSTGSETWKRYDPNSKGDGDTNSDNNSENSEKNNGQAKENEYSKDRGVTEGDKPMSE